MTRPAPPTAILSLGILALAACASPSDDALASGLVGDWRLLLAGCEEPLYDLAVGDVHTQYTFRADGTAEERIYDNGEAAYIQGTWSVEGGILQIQFSAPAYCEDGGDVVDCYHTGHAGQQVSAELRFTPGVTFDSYTYAGIVTENGLYAKLTGHRSDVDPGVGCKWVLAQHTR